MGRWVYKKAKKEPLKNYFRSYFFAGLIFNFCGLIGAASAIYHDEEINKTKWLGAISGFGCSTASFIFIIISSCTSMSNRLGAIIALAIWISGVIFGILYKYKNDR